MACTHCGSGRVYQNSIHHSYCTKCSPYLDFRRGDYVKAIGGHFKDKRGWVSRVDETSACVVWRGVWDHGIWTPLVDLKRTKRPRGEGS